MGVVLGTAVHDLVTGVTVLVQRALRPCGTPHGLLRFWSAIFAANRTASSESCEEALFRAARTSAVTVGAHFISAVAAAARRNGEPSLSHFTIGPEASSHTEGSSSLTAAASAGSAGKAAAILLSQCCLEQVLKFRGDGFVQLIYVRTALQVSAAVDWPCILRYVFRSRVSWRLRDCNWVG